MTRTTKAAAQLLSPVICGDILARDEATRVINVEMQTNGFDPWPLRSLYYGSRIISEQLQAVEDYAELRPVVAIHLLDFELFLGAVASLRPAAALRMLECKTWRYVAHQGQNFSTLMTRPALPMVTPNDQRMK